MGCSISGSWWPPRATAAGWRPRAAHAWAVRAKAHGAHVSRLGLVVGNVRAEALRTRHGYVETQRRPDTPQGDNTQVISVRVKVLPHRTWAQHLHRVPRDQPERYRTRWALANTPRQSHLVAGPSSAADFSDARTAQADMTLSQPPVHPPATETAPRERRLIWSLALLLALWTLVKLVSLSMYPLADTTEARYGEVVRQMIHTDNWAVPHIRPGEPFLAKPPLSTWTQAIAASLLGLSEFSLRLPALLLMLFTTGCMALLLRDALPAVRWGAALVLLSTPLGFAVAGSVMTDATLVASTALAQVGFWRALRSSEAQPPAAPLWLGYAALGAAVMTKGLAGLVLALLPMLLWSLATRSLLATLRRLWSWRGWALTLALAAPWFVAMEWRQPGYLHYFIVGEHFSRFLVPGWSGDRFGNAHAQPYGMIWAFLVAGALPWLLVAGGVALVRGRAQFTEAWQNLPDRALWLYLGACAVAPMLLFTMAGNIIWTYTLTGMPALSALLALLLFGGRCTRASTAAVWSGGGIVLLCAVAALVWLPKEAENKSERALLAQLPACELAQRCVLAYWVDRWVPHSAAYYSAGRAQRLSLTEALARRDEGDTVQLVLASSDTQRRAEVQASGGAFLMELHGSAAYRLSPSAR